MYRIAYVAIAGRSSARGDLVKLCELVSYVPRLSRAYLCDSYILVSCPT